MGVGFEKFERLLMNLSVSYMNFGFGTSPLRGSSLETCLSSIFVLNIV
jgi:hypothetical protein